MYLMAEGAGLLGMGRLVIGEILTRYPLDGGGDAAVRQGGVFIEHRFQAIVL